MGLLDGLDDGVVLAREQGAADRHRPSSSPETGQVDATGREALGAAVLRNLDLAVLEGTNLGLFVLPVP